MMLRSRIVTLHLLLPVVLATSAAAQRPAPAPEFVTRVTRDGVQLALTYYAGMPNAEGEKPGVVVILHDHKETRTLYSSLAHRLQAPGEAENRASLAVVTVDLRGHGGSTRQVLPDGTLVELDSARLRVADLAAMVGSDMEEVRRFLVEKNDEGKLNLNKLGLVGAGMGANVAANWAAADWATPPLAVGKQGQDVKAIAMISPHWSYRGLSMQAPMRLEPLKRHVAWLLIYGAEDRRSTNDARRIHRQLERFHPTVETQGETEPTTLATLEWPASLLGGTLLTQVGAPIEDEIVKFLSLHVSEPPYPWMTRRPRLP